MNLALAGTADTLNRHAVAYAPTINTSLRTGLEFEEMLTVRACDNTYSAPNATVAEIIQQYQWQFTPKGQVDFNAVENKLQKIKIDIQFTADELEVFWNSWKVEWHEIGRNPIEWSFPRYLYETIILPKALEEMNKNAYSGIYAAPTAGTAGVSASSVTGYAKVIADAITATDVTPIATGAFVANTMVNQLESFCDGIPQPYRDLPGDILISATNSRSYWRDYRDKFGTGNSNMGNDNNDLRIDATNKRLVPVVGMEGSNRIIFNPSSAKNMIWGTRTGFPVYPSIRWEADERVLKGLAEFYRFYGFEYWEHVFVNDQA